MTGEYDIPLAEAQVVWDPLLDEGLPPVEVIGGSLDDDRRYSNSWGACNMDFAEASDEKKLQLLLAQFVHITTIDQVPVGDTFDAFRQIPEFRAAMHEIGWRDD